MVRDRPARFRFTVSKLLSGPFVAERVLLPIRSEKCIRSSRLGQLASSPQLFSPTILITPYRRRPRLNRLKEVAYGASDAPGGPRRVSRQETGIKPKSAIFAAREARAPPTIRGQNLPFPRSPARLEESDSAGRASLAVAAAAAIAYVV